MDDGERDYFMRRDITTYCEICGKVLNRYREDEAFYESKNKLLSQSMIRSGELDYGEYATVSVNFRENRQSNSYYACFECANSIAELIKKLGGDIDEV